MRFILLATLLLSAWPAHACGPDSDCALGTRTYRIEMPEAATPSTGTLIFLHGYRGTSKGTMRNKALRAFARENDLALVAASADGPDWQIPGVPNDPGSDGGREYAYFDDLANALAETHGLSRARMIVSGFSAGGMMTWDLSCQRGPAFAAYIPVSGTFWEPIPDTCPGGPVNMVHIHGTSDKIVPIEGRPIRTTRQGHVLVAIDKLVARHDYENDVTDRNEGELECKVGRTPEDHVLGFCTHPGGHSLKMDYLRTALSILRDAGAL